METGVAEILHVKPESKFNFLQLKQFCMCFSESFEIIIVRHCHHLLTFTIRYIYEYIFYFAASAKRRVFAFSFLFNSVFGLQFTAFTVYFDIFDCFLFGLKIFLVQFQIKSQRIYVFFL
jgi:hypothetical protein